MKFWVVCTSKSFSLTAPAKTGNKNTITNSKLKDLILMVISSFDEWFPSVHWFKV
jgi:hypothetical protein